MKNWILKCLVLCALIVGVGIYRGWFTVNTSKIEQDEDAVKAEIHELGEQVKTKASDLKGSAKGHE